MGSIYEKTQSLYSQGSPFKFSASKSLYLWVYSPPRSTLHSAHRHLLIVELAPLPKKEQKQYRFFAADTSPAFGYR